MSPIFTGWPFTIGAVTLASIWPISSVHYCTNTVTATGLGGSATDSITVMVIPPPTVSFNTLPTTVGQGGSATLSWTTTHADSCFISSGIGSVAVNGATVVSPSVTTTYTITATGFGGEATSSITVTVLPPPTITFNVTPANITPGGFTTLSWNITDANSVSINNGIGAVSLTGSIAVSPLEHTTYTITAVGSGGTTTSSVSVGIKPAAAINAEPDSILSGQSTVLSWTTANADLVTIDNGIGSVATDGVHTVSPVTTTTYTLTATGPGGTTISAITVTVLDSAELGVAILSPADGETIMMPRTMVQGIVTTGADEVGVIVNGAPALVNGNNFFANNVSLSEGENTITVVGTEPDGTVVSDLVTVYVDTSQTTDWIELNTNLESGIAPLTVNLRADLHLSFTPAQTSLSAQGPTTVSINMLSDTEADCTFTTPGIYTLVYTAVDSQGVEVKQNILVYVLDRNTLDALLMSKWNEMSAALQSGDTQSALNYFVAGNREKYAETFNMMGNVEINAIFSGLNGIELEVNYGRVAECGVLRVEGGKTYSYPVIFVKDEKNIWKIFDF